MTPDERPGFWRAFWQILTRYQADKIVPWVGLRNTIGFVLPLAAGVAFGSVAHGVVVGMGALNVSFSDSSEPHIVRARRMLAAAVLVGIAVFLGSVFARQHVMAVTLTSLWALAAGFLVALSADAADLGVMSLVTLVVFTAQPLPVPQAIGAGLLAFAGGLLQCVFSLGLWPVRQYEPVRRVLADFFAELGAFGPASISASSAPPATAASTTSHNALESMASNRSVEAERYRSLHQQAERIRLSLMVLARLRARLERDTAETEKAHLLDHGFELAAKIAQSISHALSQGTPLPTTAADLAAFTAIGDTLRQSLDHLEPAAAALVSEAVFQIDALAGQYRSSLDLAAHATPQGRDAFAREQAHEAWGLRLSGTFAILRANLSPGSTAFRHAVRMAACVAAADALGRAMGWERSYWGPMTVAIVLKPDFGATFSRGVLRLIGTFTGLVLSTVLFHVMPDTVWLQITLIAVVMFFLRSYGPAHYGILVVAVTALVVLLFAVSGVEPAAVITARGLNTVGGGLIALVAYALWPTWERTQISEIIAQLLDAYRLYFNAVRQSYIQPGPEASRLLNHTRVAARLARSNLEASFDRFASEPGESKEAISLLNAVMASSHRLVHAVMALEAGLARSSFASPRPAFFRFADHTELTLYYLTAMLRGSPMGAEHLPNLRAAHRELAHSGDSHVERYALVNTETDRITNSLNTLSGKLFEWLAVSADQQPAASAH